MFDLTGGAFDISIGTGLPSLELDADGFLVRATTDGVQVDLGGIGKGYAVDLMAELLEEWGLQRALVHGGFSSVLALDPRTGEPARRRRAAWVALPRPESAGVEGPRLAPGAVADALTTAFMLLDAEEIAALCAGTPGLEAWVLSDGECAELRHFGGRL